MTHTELFTQLMQASAVAAGLLTWALANRAMLAPRAWYWRATVWPCYQAVATFGVSCKRHARPALGIPWWVGILDGSADSSFPLTSSRLWLGLARLIQSAFRSQAGPGHRACWHSCRRRPWLGEWLIAITNNRSWPTPTTLMSQIGSTGNPPRVAPAAVLGVTDLGQTIELDLPIDPADLSDLEELEEASASHPTVPASLAHPPRPTGRHLQLPRLGIYQRQVQHRRAKCADDFGAEQLRDRQGRRKSGDLVVYHVKLMARSRTAGIVRAVLGLNDILVESKWGRMGVYLHPVEKSCYGMPTSSSTAANAAPMSSPWWARIKRRRQAPWNRKKRRRKARWNRLLPMTRSATSAVPVPTP